MSEENINIISNEALLEYLKINLSLGKRREFVRIPGMKVFTHEYIQLKFENEVISEIEI